MEFLSFETQCSFCFDTDPDYLGRCCDVQEKVSQKLSVSLSTPHLSHQSITQYSSVNLKPDS